MMTPVGYICMADARKKYNLGSQNTFYNLIIYHKIRIKKVLSRTFYSEEDLAKISKQNELKSMRWIMKEMKISSSIFYKLVKELKINYVKFSGHKLYNYNDFKREVERYLNE